MESMAHFGLLHFHHIDGAVHEMVHDVLLLAGVWLLEWEYVLNQLHRVLLELLVNLGVYNIQRWHFDFRNKVFKVT